mgnify:CR=1 FL=1
MKILGIGNAIVDVICKIEENFITKNNLTKILISIPSLLKRNSLIEQMKDKDLDYGIINDWFEFLKSKHEVLICQNDIDQGFILKNFHLGILTEKDVFGFKRNNKERKHSKNLINYFLYNKRFLFGPFVYRLGHVVFILERGVRFP